MKKLKNLSTRNDISKAIDSQYVKLKTTLYDKLMSAPYPFSDELNSKAEYEFRQCHVLTVKIEHQWRKFVFLAPNNDVERDKFHRIRLDILKLINKKLKERQYLYGIKYFFKIYKVDKYLYLA